MKLVLILVTMAVAMVTLILWGDSMMPDGATVAKTTLGLFKDVNDDSNDSSSSSSNDSEDKVMPTNDYVKEMMDKMIAVAKEEKEAHATGMVDIDSELARRKLAFGRKKGGAPKKQKNQPKTKDKKKRKKIDIRKDEVGGGPPTKFKHGKAFQAHKDKIKEGKGLVGKEQQPPQQPPMPLSKQWKEKHPKKSPQQNKKKASEDDGGVDLIAKIYRNKKGLRSKQKATNEGAKNEPGVYQKGINHACTVSIRCSSLNMVILILIICFFV